MAESFDPYYIWLGIPPAEQPADHYRLLGISRFESNLDVIANAADQRVRHLRNMQTGKRQAESQKLLNEIAQASGTLLDPDKRTEYDAKLKLSEVAKQTVPVIVAVRPLAVTNPPATASASPPPSAMSHSSAGTPSGVTANRSTLTIVTICTLAGLAATAVIVLVAVASLPSWRHET